MQEVFYDRGTVPKDKSRVRVSGRSRRGGREFNAFELSQVADFFGVTRSLAAHVLRNLRFLSDSERDRLIDMANREESDRVLSSGRLPQDSQEPIAFVSRLLVLAIEARRRGALSTERIKQIAALSELDDENRVRLLASDAGSVGDRHSARSRPA